MRQLELFNRLLSENNIWDAHTVIKNMYIRNLGDKDIFEKYFNFAMLIGSYPIEINTRKFFITEAETALVFFSENSDMDVEQLSFIRNCRDKLMEVTKDIKELENKLNKKENEDIIEKNNNCLLDLVKLKGKLFEVRQQDQFDKLLLEVNSKENSLKKESLTDEQKKLYDSLTKEYSEIISGKIVQINHLNNIEYNQLAIKNFQYVFEEFKSNEDKYISSESQLFTLVSKRLFAYDLSKLFNETIVYYNHIYYFIFSKLDDAGKFRLTEISIDTRRTNI